MSILQIDLSELNNVKNKSKIGNLILENRNSIELLDLKDFINLKMLNINFCNIKHIINFPEKLKYLACMFNDIENLDNLPQSLFKLQCSNNKLKSLNNLPTNLHYLICNCNYIETIDNLPDTLLSLICADNQIKSLDLPDNLIELICNFNQITHLKLPPKLIELYCADNQLTSLNLPKTLRNLVCHNNPFYYPFIVTIKNLHTFNNFRLLYFRLKFSNKLEKIYLRSHINRINKFKENLMQVICHPDNFNKFESLELIDF